MQWAVRTLVATGPLLMALVVLVYGLGQQQAQGYEMWAWDELFIGQLDGSMNATWLTSLFLVAMLMLASARRLFTPKSGGSWWVFAALAAQGWLRLEPSTAGLITENLAVTLDIVIVVGAFSLIAHLAWWFESRQHAML